MDLFSRKILTCKFASRVQRIHVCYTRRVRVSVASPREYDNVMCIASYGIVRFHLLVARRRVDLASENARSIANIISLSLQEKRSSRRERMNAQARHRAVHVIANLLPGGSSLSIAFSSKQRYVSFRLYRRVLSAVYR